ncbi:MAG: outer membrane lipoprotein chaperone LolA [Oxalobacter sp.]
MKSFFSKLVGICILLMFPLFANASSIGQLKSFSVTAHSASGTFTQTLVRSGRAAKTSSGSFVFSRPGKFIWKYQTPYSQTLQSDGASLYIYDKDLNQVTIRRLGAALGSSPAAILFGSNNLEKNFKLHDLGSNDGCEWVEVVPRSRDTPFTRINIGMQNSMPRAMELYDSLGNKTVVNFTGFRKNPPINAGSFRFTIPQGADVFRH